MGAYDGRRTDVQSLRSPERGGDQGAVYGACAMVMALTRSVWGYRGFILGNVKREFQSKYRNSLLGAAWTVLNPLAMIVVYTVIFSEVMRAKLPGIDTTFGYSIFLCAGVLVWTYFAEIIGRAQSVFIENANLLKKISFPRMCLPVVVVANATLNFAIVFGLRSEEHTSELQSLMRSSYAVFCLKKKKKTKGYEGT